MNGTVFNGLDLAVIIAFALGMIVTVWFSMRKKNESGKDYFLSGRDANWLQIGSSIFSSNIGSEHLVGLAGAGFVTGMAMAHWEMHAYWILILGWAFVPLYDRMKVFTMPEFLELRFSRGSRNVLSLLTMASLVLTKIAATIYAGDVVIRTLLNVDHIDIFGHQIDVFWAIALGLAFTTGLYTVFGGMRVIMYTAVLQAPVLIFGSVCILYMGLRVLGHGSLIDGWHATLDDGRRQCSPRPLHPRSRLAVAGDSARLGHHRFLVLVYRPIHRPARAGRQKPAGIAARHHPRRLFQADAGVHLPRAGHDCLCADQDAGRRFQHQR